MQSQRLATAALACSSCRSVCSTPILLEYKQPRQPQSRKAKAASPKWWPFQPRTQSAPQPSRKVWRGVGPRPPSLGWRQQQQQQRRRRQQEPSPARQPNREAEVLSGRWAMVFVAALVAPDLLGAPLVLLPDLLHSRQLLVACLAIFGAIGGLEAYRAAALKEETDWERRVYPGRASLKQRVAELRRSLRRMGRAWRRQQQLEEQEEQEGLAASSSVGSRGGYAAAPGLGVWSAWLGGLPGWLSGGWWLEIREALSEGELEGLKSSELWMGRLATIAFLGIIAAGTVTGRGPVSNLLDSLEAVQHWGGSY